MDRGTPAVAVGSAVGSIEDCPEPPSGLIGKRWLELGGKYGALGCPQGPERDVPGRRGRIQTFEYGEVAWSPEQGDNLVVAAYQRGISLVVSWGPTAPLHYDFFLVRWDLNGVNVGQQEVRFGAHDSGRFYTSPERGGLYRVVVEGCDGRTLSSSVCRQGWTVPLAVTITGSTSDGIVDPTGCDNDAGGLIGAKWRSLGAGRGPLGCPTGPESEVPGRNGKARSFARGEIVWSPDQGAEFVVAAYLHRNRVTVDWGPTDPFSYNLFQVRWERLDSDDPTQLGQDEISGFNRDPIVRGRWSTVLHGLGTYRFIVQGCDSGWSGSRCRQGWSIPVSVRLAAYTGSPNRCAEQAGGLIGERWHELDAWDGPLGCPVSAERDVPGRRGRIQTFEYGQVAWSPEQGERMVIAAYLQGGLTPPTPGATRPGGTMTVDWGPAGPFHYDFFLVRWGTSVADAVQEEIRGGPRDRGTFIAANDRTGPYTFIVEGCDGRVLAPSRCRQGWSIPVAVHAAPPGDVPIADISMDSPGTAADKEAARVARAADHLACTRHVGLDGGQPSEDLGTVLYARLRRVQAYGLGDRCPGELPNILVVNEALRWIQPGELGTEFLDCGIHGDYDAFLKGLLGLTYRYYTLLHPDVRHRIATKLVNVNGPHDIRVETKVFCRFAEGPETENHLLMIESARYLANQLVFPLTRDALHHNVDNGEEEWLLNFLHTIARHDFLEFNSRPYQRYSMHALMNLADFAQSPRMRTAAQIVLDYTTTKFAVTSNSLRRAGPFRRLDNRADADNQSYFTGNSDPQTMFFLTYTGMSTFVDGKIPNNWTIEATIAGLAGYRPPQAAYQLAIDKAQPAEHRFFHGPRPRLREAEEADPGVEIYSSSPSFLLTAGGVWLNSGMKSDWINGYRDTGVAQATTLMPTASNLTRDNLIRFNGLRTGGSPGDRNVINTCLAGGFACGVQMVIPAQFLACATPRGSAWLFLDNGCAGTGFYVALHRNAHGRIEYPVAAYPGDVGFLYAVEATPNLTFTQFIDQTLAANNGIPDELTLHDTYEFRTPDGLHRYNFRLHPDGNKYNNRIIAVDDNDATPIPQWPLVRGPHLASDGHSGYLTIRSHPSCQPLILDFRDRAWPIRTEPTTPCPPAPPAP